jgi:endoribonuclease Dicer
VDQLKYKQAEEYRLAEKEGRLPGQYWLDIEPPKVSIPDNTDENEF